MGASNHSPPPVTEVLFLNGINSTSTGKHFASALAARTSILDLLYPLECLNCGNPTEDKCGFCKECEPQIRTNYYCCRKCATPIPEVVPNDDCFRCREEKWKFDHVVALGPYENVAREVAIKIKKSRAEPLRMSIARLLAEKCRDDISVETMQSVVVPVPNHWTHRLQGVANTSRSIARVFAKEMALPLVDNAIRRIRKTQKQGMLPWTERRKNVRGAFQVKTAQPLTARHVYLVDDVLTSGATANELSKVLKKAGARRVNVVVVARGKGARENVTAA